PTTRCRSSPGSTPYCGQERGLDIPFVLISGTIGEEVAVAARQRGTAGHRLKDRLTHLGPPSALGRMARSLARTAGSRYCRVDSSLARVGPTPRLGQAGRCDPLILAPRERHRQGTGAELP